MWGRTDVYVDTVECVNLLRCAAVVDVTCDSVKLEEFTDVIVVTVVVLITYIRLFWLHLVICSVTCFRKRVPGYNYPGIQTQFQILS